MENIYEKLYSSFAEPRLHLLQAEQEELIQELASALSVPPEKQMLLKDFITNIRSDWGVNTFSIGLRMGLELLTPYECPSDYRILRHFLSQLDQPVT